MKFTKLFTVALVLVFGFTMCTEKKKAEVAEPEVEELSKVYDVVETMPEFPGGVEAMFAWVNNSIKYPAMAKDLGLEGEVICTFIVEKDGSIDSINVVAPVDSLLDKEAVRVISSMPKWTPGMQGEDTMRVRYAMPIPFRLKETEVEKTR